MTYTQNDTENRKRKNGNVSGEYFLSFFLAAAAFTLVFIIFFWSGGTYNCSAMPSLDVNCNKRSATKHLEAVRVVALLPVASDANQAPAN